MSKKYSTKLILEPIRPVLSRASEILADTFDTLLRRKDALTPPRKLRSMVCGPDAKLYRSLGECYFLCSRALCALETKEDVLDVGCGCGKQAVPLARYLSKDSTYEGFDIVGPSIEWCRKNITPKYPNFHFQLADVYNKAYNPNGKHRASEHRFPYPNEFFDFAFATSVFTHMLPEDMEHYMSEIARLLKSGGRCFISYFLLNEESLRLINAKTCSWDFKYDFGKYRALDQATPESGVSYDEEFILGLSKIRPQSQATCTLRLMVVAQRITRLRAFSRHYCRLERVVSCGTQANGSRPVCAIS